MATRLIRSLYNILPEQRGGVLTIGNFDGVHLGHQQLLSTVVEIAKAHHTTSTVITFEPHPFEFFAGNEVRIPRITRLREKFYALRDCGVDHVLILPFNQQLAELSPSDFVNRILYKNLRPLQMIVGDDFRFGYKRQGDFALLQKMGAELGFQVAALPTIEILGERVSSTRVRQALAKGDQKLAETLLGRPYSMMGRIRLGNQLGRKLGFPTANIFLHRKLTPIQGVYTVYMHGISDKPLEGVANIGVRPTVDGTRSLLEVHLLDFNQQIYGSYVSVEFCQKLRDEVRYANLDLLKEAIAKDVEIARQYFKNKSVL